MKAFFVTVFLFLVVSSAVVFFWASPKARSQGPSSTAENFAHQEQPLREFWPAPEFSFVDHRGETVSNPTLRGTPWVANFIFTTCRSVCPLLTTKMVRLQRETPNWPVKFLSFSVDPEHDTEQALADYARKWNDGETRWHLLRTTPAGVDAFAQGFRITAQKADGGPDAVYHSQVFVLVDAQGIVRGIYDSEDIEDFKALRRGLQKLTGAMEAPLAQERSGETLYRELSCGNCHERSELAPALGGLFGKSRELENALTVTADDAYLRAAILSPDSHRVKGYPLRMPSYAGHVSAAELENLLQYLKALPSAAPEAMANVYVDPICQMEVRATPDVLHVGDVYFCSAHCKSEYEKSLKVKSNHAR